MIMKFYFYELRISLILAFVLVFYNECFVYWISYYNWPKLHKELNGNSTRLLLIADPQLIGENDEPWYQKSFAIWDSDRYLSKTFSFVNWYVKPNSTLFLGDLFDEGLKATDEQYNRYYKRFQSIYQCNEIRKEHGTDQIFISGDNDIGGEYGDRTQLLQERFESYFGTIVSVSQLNSFMNIFKLDLDYQVDFLSRKNQIVRLKKQLNKKKRLNIVLNHMSLFQRGHHEFKTIVDTLKAKLVIKGDSHKFYLINYSFDQRELLAYDQEMNKQYSLDLNSNRKEIYELSIPTCSYRMGVKNMGFGVLTIESSGKAFLSILWLPSRFKALYYYGYFLLIALSYIIIRFLLQIVLYFYKYKKKTP